jgi:thiamine monophosphate synthase
MTDEQQKNHATIGGLCATVQMARYALNECHSLALALAVDGVDLGQSDITKAARDKLEEIIPLLLKLPREATQHMRVKRPAGSLQ